MTTDDTRTTLRLVAPPMLLTLAVTLIGIGQRQFWRDEQATWWASSLPLGQLRRLIEVVDVVLLPYYLLMHVWIKVFGSSEIAMRVPSALLISAAAGLIALIGRRLFDAHTGLLAGLLFALVPAVSRYGGEARPYAMAVAATLAATLLLLRALDRPSRLRWTLYGLAVIWIGLSHLVSLSVLAAHLILVIALGRDRDGPAGSGLDRRVLIAWPVSVAAALALVAPVIVFSSRQGAQISWIPEPTWAVVRSFPGDVALSDPVAAIVLTLGILGLVLLAVAGGRARWFAAALAAWLLLPPLLGYLTFDALGLFYPRYFLFTLPAALLAAAFALRRVAKNQRALIAVGVTAALALGLAGLSQHRHVRSDAVENEYAFRDAADWLNDRIRPGDRVAYVGYPRLYRGFSYEFEQLPGPDPDEVYSYVSRRRSWWWNHKISEDPAEAFAGVDRFWLVVANPNAGPLSRLPRAGRAYIQEHYTVAETQTFHQLQVTLLTSNG